MTVLEARSTGKFARDDVLVGPDWLEQHLHDPAVRIVEVDVSRSTFDEGHLPGAVLWNIYADLKDAEYRPVDQAGIERIFARSGITAGSTVVFYGYAPAIGLWLMKLYGHADVRLLDCSRETWQREGRPWSTEPAGAVPTTYRVGAADARIRAARSDVEKAVADRTAVLLDVRSESEFDGERFWPSGGEEAGGRAGHIPGAVRLPIDEIRDERGAFVSSAKLRELFAAADVDGEVITYCTVGGRACTAWFVLPYLLGRDRVRVYDGSWAEWGRTPEVPVVGQSVTLSKPTVQTKELTMTGLVRKSLNAPEEVRPFEGGTGQLELVNLDAGAVGRATFMPGWKWSEHVKPIAKTDSCRAAHLGYFVSGRMKVVMDDGAEMEYGPGDFASMAPGHDAWIIGDEPCVVIDWQGFADYAKR
jgi:thiosulfate/3-mercaptopyruvate sulfurtransferase